MLIRTRKNPFVRVDQARIGLRQRRVVEPVLVLVFGLKFSSTTSAAQRLASMLLARGFVRKSIATAFLVAV